MNEGLGFASEDAIREYAKRHGVDVIIKTTYYDTKYWKCAQNKCKFRFTVKKSDGIFTIATSNSASHSHDVKGPEIKSRPLVWIGVPGPEGFPISKLTSASIPFDEPVNKAPTEIRCLHLAVGLKRTLGKEIVEADATGNDRIWMHQSLATMLLATSDNPLIHQHRFVNWDKFLNPYALVENLPRDSSPIIVIGRTSYPKSGSLSLSEFYDHANFMCRAKGIELYPSYEELMFEEEKISDIRIHDEIAREGPPEFQFRPRTCNGLGSCDLADVEPTAKMVIKRNFSCSKEHVLFVPATVRDNLLCVPPGSRGLAHPLNRRPTYTPKEHWFHQEFIPSLLDFGELRVFLRATGPNPDNVEIISICYTYLEGDEKEDLDAQAFRPGVFHFIDDPLIRKKKAKELERFALYQYTALRRHREAPQAFASLEVGVRLDIGISEENENGRFFIVESARWYGACQFVSQHLEPPWTKIAEGFADSFRSLLNRREEERLYGDLVIRRP